MPSLATQKLHWRQNAKYMIFRILIVVYLVSLRCCTARRGHRERHHAPTQAKKSLTHKPSSPSLTGKETTRFKPVRLAICLTGQLVRLELGSKLDNLILPILSQGIYVDLYLLLDNELEKAKGVKDEERKILSVHTTYKNYRFRGDALALEIKDYIVQHRQGNKTAEFDAMARLVPPSKSSFFDPREKMDSAFVRNRFQAHMNWMNGLRECMIWLDSKEITLDMRYDFVMRLRDDTYVWKPFRMNVSKYKNHVVSTRFKGWGAVNDHNIFADRKYADIIFRGIVEEFYFADSSWFYKLHHEASMKRFFL